jgi:hypothetical protein
VAYSFENMVVKLEFGIQSPLRGLVHIGLGRSRSNWQSAISMVSFHLRVYSNKGSRMGWKKWPVPWRSRWSELVMFECRVPKM